MSAPCWEPGHGAQARTHSQKEADAERVLRDTPWPRAAGMTATLRTEELSEHPQRPASMSKVTALRCRARMAEELDQRRSRLIWKVHTEAGLGKAFTERCC